MNRTRLLLALVMGGLIGTFFTLDLGRYLTLGALQAQQAALAQWVDSHFVSASLLFVLIYVLSTALSLPGASLLTLGGSAVFGVAWGLLLVSFASSIGATLAFLSARFLLRDWVTARFGDKLTTFHSGMAKEGAFYLLSLRLIPVFPFFLVNLLMGLTPIRVSTYYWVSQLGMLPGTFVYVLAGSELGQLTSTGNILSPGLMMALTLLGLMPWLVKKLTAHLAQRRLLATYRKPARYDYNLLVIGAGAGGLVTSYIAAAVKAKVALIEKHKMGGDCLNSGCVPSKALIRCARFAAEQRKADELGFSPSHSRADFAAVMERVAEVIKAVEPHDSIKRYQGLGVECIEGEARLVSPWEVEVNGQRLASRHIVIATGARPLVPKLPGLDQVPYLTSDSLWQLRTPPRRLLVLGGGPIGCELAQSFAQLGIPVTLVELSEQLLPREDREVADALAGQMSRDGVRLLTGWRAERADYLPAAEGDLPIRLQLRRGDETQVIEGDQLLLALGRVANVSGFGLEALGVELAPRGTIAVDGFLATNFPSILAVGDVAGPYQFTHFAAHQAWYAAVNALFGQFKRFRADYRVIPAATYTTPEIARVGLNRKEAEAQGIPFEATRFELAELDRAIADGERHGFVEVLTVPGKDTILGATIVGTHAGERIAEFVLAMRHRLGLGKILGTIHAYPTLMEGNKYVAGEWKRAHQPTRVLALLARYHRWRRGA
ncbi:pyridine nucleotide-disulfide oxidoreductase [Aeromonas veronii]|uniref:Pyridine nucleotide-disulfide oxidoreductase n=1 Tax=Aeromonas veronii TaxID=654 RepID=A0A160EU32_AERVE|nr:MULTISPECIES: bifunctional TVP38/TMEM64 family protein/FAD-dependent oxidoreductase [Aeromonas]ANB52105.1 pyridine nucleotide-disulfide oxidoreductase [Aeromonas veronii]MBL0440504.1 FAD-dependent oxidoreductase [Aeromonas veronii]MBL0641634.1 FAD-dependent oxidoreductase [Aeromonas veronii]MBS4697695.1 FAD-dependent oxidoreductase [Aeromonas allosaccharophila]MCE9954034.1 FAD-dependent oxidoreductase [Aeromonas allosaccharophila]